MYLFSGVLCLSVTALLFGITLIGARNPVRPFWAQEGIIANFLTPLMVGLLVMGIVNGAQGFAQGFPSLMEWGLVALTLGVTLVAFLMLGIRKRLARYEAETKSGTVLTVDFQGLRQQQAVTEERNETPPRKAA